MIYSIILEVTQLTRLIYKSKLQAWVWYNTYSFTQSPFVIPYIGYTLKPKIEGVGGKKGL
jgi:hypothetical protein